MVAKTAKSLSKYSLILSGYSIAAITGLILGGWAGLYLLVYIINA